MKDKAFIKLPRLFTEQDLNPRHSVILDGAPAHYLINVMRRGVGDKMRLFNGRDGEWIYEVSKTTKKILEAACLEQYRTQPPPRPSVHLYFSPIKKPRLQWLIEKSVELGATHLHPVITQNTENRKIKDDKIAHYITGAAEQCERLDLPDLLDPQPLSAILDRTDKCPLIVCLERNEKTPLITALLPEKEEETALLIGPEGGFTQEESALFINSKNIIPASLGPYILRAETAVCAALSAILLRT